VTSVKYRENMSLLDSILIDLQYPVHFDRLNTFVSDISGIDSLAALVCLLKDNKSPTFIPTIVDVSCEYGEKESEFLRVTRDIHAAFSATNGRILPTIILDVNELWRRLVCIGIPDVVRKSNFYSPCIGCHLVFHIARIKLAQHLNLNKVISGERELHGDKEKINQLDFVLDFYNSIYDRYEIKHIQPVRGIRNRSEIDAMIAGYGIDPVDVKCLFSRNYYKTNTNVLDVEREDIAKYLTLLQETLETPQAPVQIKCRVL